ncbi:MAG: DNA recombination protein RmuC, partial [Methylophilaceae bacterium]
MDTVFIILAVLQLLALAWLVWRDLQSTQNTLLLQNLEDKHRAMLLDLNDGLNKLADRMNASTLENSERLKQSVSAELQATRDAMQALQLAQNSSLAQTRETVLEKLHTTLSEQGKAQQALINDTMLKATTTLTQSIESLSKIVDARLEEIGGKVSE